MSTTYVSKRAHDHDLEEVDAQKPLTVNVTARDIKLAKAKNSKECALARAVKREYPVKAAYFLRTTAWLEYPTKMVRYRLPQSVQKEIVSFDRNKMMSTGNYTLAADARNLRKPRTKSRKVRGPMGKKLVLRSRKSIRAHRIEGVRDQFEPKDEEKS
jgi:hypothetical protein